MNNELITYLRAGYPGLCIVTPEEARAEAVVGAACADLGRKLAAWSSTDGLVELPEGRATPCPDPLDALVLAARLFEQTTRGSVVLLRDLQLHLDTVRPDPGPPAARHAAAGQGQGPRAHPAGLPPQAAGRTRTRVRAGGLRAARQRRAWAESSTASSAWPMRAAPDAAVREAALRNALGLTTVEAENVFALSLVQQRVGSTRRWWRPKRPAP